MAEKIDVTVSEKLRPLVPKFLERSAAEVERMRAALAAGDAPALQQLAHKMSGTSGSYGFHQLGELAKQLEAAAKAGDSASFPRLVAAIGEHLARVNIRYV